MVKKRVKRKKPKTPRKKISKPKKLQKISGSRKQKSFRGRKRKKLSREERLKLQVQSPKPFERTPNAANVLILVSAIILFVQGLFLMALAFLPIGILPLLRIQLILSLGKTSMLVFGLIWVFLGVIILLLEQGIKTTRKLVYQILLLIISIIIFLTGRIVCGILAFVAAIIYLATRKSVYKRRYTRIRKRY